MLRGLFLKELTILGHDDDIHRIILSCRPVETMPKGFAYDRAP
jgi:hypothetical protein